MDKFQQPSKNSYDYQNQRSHNNMPPHYVEKQTSFHDGSRYDDIKEGDIIELNVNGRAEYIICTGFIGSRKNVVYGVPDFQSQNQKEEKPPGFFQSLIGGYSKSEDQSFSKNATNSNQIVRIKICQCSLEELTQRCSFQKNNFDNVNLEPNRPEAIVDRAMFKLTDPKASPHFQNSKDWVLWCRYGKDIITREMHVPSHLGLASASGKY